MDEISTPTSTHAETTDASETTDPAAQAARAAPDREGLHEPLSPGWHRRLRKAVIQQALVGGRRHQPVLHVGEPGGAARHLLVDALEPSDPGLRTDVVATLLDQVRRDRAGLDDETPLVWLARDGDLDLQDVDVRWLVAARSASQESGHPLEMVVVTRRGWRDPRSGLTRSWVRLRLPPRDPA